jgi:hypothetical protein
MKSRVSSDDAADSPFEVQERDGILRLEIPGTTNWKQVWILSAVILAAGYFGALAFLAIRGREMLSHPYSVLVVICFVASSLYRFTAALFSSQTIEIDHSSMRIRNTVAGIGFTRSYDLVAVTDLEFIGAHDIQVQSGTPTHLHFQIGWFLWSPKSSDEQRHYPSHLMFHYGTKPVTIAPGLRPDEMLRLLKVLAPYLAPAKLLYEKAYQARRVSTLPS